MALVLNNQRVYVSKVEEHTRDTKDGKRKYTKGLISFNSSSKVNKDEYKNDDPFLINYVCFSREANTLINELIIKQGERGKVLEVSGKIFTRSYEDKNTGKKVYSNEFVIYTAKEVVKKSDKKEVKQEEFDEIPF